MNDLFSSLKIALSEVALNVHRALEDSSEQSLWDKCEQQRTSISAAFAQADLSVLEWELNHEKLQYDPCRTIQDIGSLERKFSERAGYLAGADRYVND